MHHLRTIAAAGALALAFGGAAAAQTEIELYFPVPVEGKLAAEMKNLMERFNAACAANPAVPRPKIMILQHGYVAKDAADADLAAEELNAFYCYFGAWFVNKRPITQGLIEPITPEEMAAHPFYSAKAMRENLLIGDTAEVIEKLKKI